MLIDNTADKQLRQALPPGEVRALDRALEAIGCGQHDVVLTPLKTQPAPRDDENRAAIRFTQYGDNQLLFSMKNRGSLTEFYCRLDFKKMPVPGLQMREVQRLLSNALKESGYGTPSAEERQQTPAAPATASRVSPQSDVREVREVPKVITPAPPLAQQDEDDEVESPAQTLARKGFVNRDYEVRAFLVNLAKTHGTDPYERKVVRTALSECFGTKVGAGIVVTHLIRKGYFVQVDKKLRAIKPDEPPVPYSGEIGTPTTPTLPDDDPIVVRQRQVAAMFDREVAKKAGLAGKKAELSELLRQQEELATRIAQKREEVETDEATVLSEDTLAEFDKLLLRLGNSHPQLVRELKAS